MAGKLQGKNIVVLGATSGMGRATAFLFAREGARLALAGRRAGKLQELGEQIAAETGTVTLGIPCDATDRAQVDSLLNAARAQLGKIDVVVYATGTNTPDRSLDRLTPEVWDDLIDTNLKGAYHCTQLLVPIFREQGEGLLIYISSISALRGDVSGIAYQASKRGIDGLAQGVMVEEKANGFRTSVVYPGLVDTELILKRPTVTPPEVMQHALQPEDIAEACLLIASLPVRCHVPELVIQPAKL